MSANYPSLLVAALAHPARAIEGGFTKRVDSAEQPKQEIELDRDSCSEKIGGIRVSVNISARQNYLNTHCREKNDGDYISASFKAALMKPFGM